MSGGDARYRVSEAMNKDARILLFLTVGALGLAVIAIAVWLYLDSTRVVRSAGLAAESGGSATGPASMPRLATEQELAVASRALSSNSVIALSIERFLLGLKRYPLSLDELVEEPRNLGSEEKWDGPYINNPRLLFDPWGSKYRYLSPGVHNDFSYDLWTCGADGVSGTADDIGNW